MTGIWARASLTALALTVSGCNQTSAPSAAANVVAQLDPTGLSSTAIGMAESSRPEAAGDDSAAPDLSMFAPRLRDVAAGHTTRPNMLASIDSKMDEMMALQTMGIASSVAGAAIGGVMTGGTSLVSAAPGIAMQAAMTGVMTSQMAAAKTQSRAAVAAADAERAANRIVPDEDRPSEARAILSLVGNAGTRSATWQNPETGASGKVTIQAVNKKNVPDTLICRLVKQEWKSGKSTRTGSMPICQSGGEWYDLS